jgi:hypothetical protein
MISTEDLKSASLTLARIGDMGFRTKMTVECEHFVELHVWNTGRSREIISEAPTLTAAAKKILLTLNSETE